MRERLHFGGRKSITLLEGSQASPTRSADKGCDGSEDVWVARRSSLSHSAEFDFSWVMCRAWDNLSPAASSNSDELKSGELHDKHSSNF